MHRIKFEDWAYLAQANPDSFESLRALTLDAAIRRLPPERRVRMQRLQWRIDRLRERSANPLSACIRIADMMWDSFNELNNSYQLPDGPVLNCLSASRKAKVLPFHSPKLLTDQ